jgi:hypothetical protein
MDFVALSLHPVEEPLQANKLSLPAKKDLFLLRMELLKGLPGGNSKFAAGLLHVIIKIPIRRRVPGGKGFFLDRFSGVRNDLLPINSDDPSEPLTGWTGTDRAVKGEEKGFGL